MSLGNCHFGWTLSCSSGRLIAVLIDDRDPGIPMPPPQGVVAQVPLERISPSTRQ